MSGAPETPEMPIVDREPGPQILGNKLRAQLVDQRAQAGLTQQEVAGQLDISLSTVIRAETGPNLPSTVTAVAMLAVYGAIEAIKPVRTSLRRIADLQRRIQERFPGAPDEQLAYAEYEAYATKLQIYRPDFLPDFLRSDIYSSLLRRGVLEQDASPGWYDDYIARRREYLLGPHGPAIHIIIDEKLLYYAKSVQVSSGDPQYPIVDETVAQLQAVNTVGKRLRGEAVALDFNPNISVQMAAFAGGSHRLMAYNVGVTGMHFADPDAELRRYYPHQDVDGYTPSTRIAKFEEAFLAVAASLPGPENTDDLLAASKDEILTPAG